MIYIHKNDTNYQRIWRNNKTVRLFLNKTRGTVIKESIINTSSLFKLANKKNFNQIHR